MAFGLKYIQGAEADKSRALKKELQEQSDDGIAAVSYTHLTLPTILLV